jgi:exodeoxyribonuclease VII small subunit
VTDADADPGYEAAMSELEQILAELEAGNVDIDLLADRVRRAATLVRRCRGRIDDARTEVTRIVAELDDVAPPAPLSNGGEPSGDGDP